MSLTNVSEKQEDISFVWRVSSLTKGRLSMSAESTHSSPAILVVDSALSRLEEHRIDMPNVGNDMQKRIKRSFSAPTNLDGSSEHIGSVVNDHMIFTSPNHGHPENAASVNNAEHANIAIENEGTNIEEKAVCRICLVELEESGETFKMGCSCKGDLALAHQSCAVEWFNIKGNSKCDVCKQDVHNLPTHLLKMHNNQTARDGSQGEVTPYRVWRDVPVLVLVSMVAYFCLLEQLLVTEMGTHSLALALPFSCVLGLLSSMIASIVVSRNHIWAYASIQFLFVILFAHVMYNMLRVTPVLAVLLSSFIGFGITMSVNSLVMEYLTWCARQVMQSADQQNNTNGQHEQSRDNPETEIEVSLSHDRHSQNP